MKTAWIASTAMAAALTAGCALPTESPYETKVNFWPVARYDAAKEGDGYRLDGLLTLIHAEESESSGEFRFFPLFERQTGPHGSELTIGASELLPLYRQSSNPRTSELEVLSALNIVSLVSGTKHYASEEQEGQPTSEEFEIFDLLGRVFNVYRESSRAGESGELPEQSREVLSALWGKGFHLYQSERVPVYSTASEQRVLVGTQESHSALKLLAGAFALEEYEQSERGNYDWRFLSLFRTDELSLASEQGQQARDGEPGWSRFQFLGPIYRSERKGESYESSLAFLYNYADNGEQRTLRLFHLIPIHF